MSHTPGPWKVIPSPHGSKYKCVQIGKDEMYATLEMLPADARLIALAPDFAALLEETANMLRGMTLDPAIPLHAKDAMRARITKLETAIAKAEG